MSVRDLLLVGKTESAMVVPSVWTDVTGPLPMVKQRDNGQPSGTGNRAVGPWLTPYGVVGWSIGILTDEDYTHNSFYGRQASIGIYAWDGAPGAHLYDVYGVGQSDFSATDNPESIQYYGGLYGYYVGGTTSATGGMWLINNPYNKTCGIMKWRSDAWATGFVSKTTSPTGADSQGTVVRKINVGSVTNYFIATYVDQNFRVAADTTQVRFARSATNGDYWTWYSVTVPACRGYKIVDIVYAAGRYVMIVNRYTSSFFWNVNFHTFTSTDGITWTELTGPNTPSGLVSPILDDLVQGFVSLTADPTTNTFIAITCNGDLLKSNDGLSWSRSDALLNLGFDVTNMRYGNATQAHQSSGGVLVVSGNRTFYSRDSGATWFRGADLPITLTASDAYDTEFTSLDQLTGKYLVLMNQYGADGKVRAKVFVGG